MRSGDAELVHEFHWPNKKKQALTLVGILSILTLGYSRKKLNRGGGLGYFQGLIKNEVEFPRVTKKK